MDCSADRFINCAKASKSKSLSLRRSSRCLLHSTILGSLGGRTVLIPLSYSDVAGKDPGLQRASNPWFSWFPFKPRCLSSYPGNFIIAIVTPLSFHVPPFANVGFIMYTYIVFERNATPNPAPGWAGLHFASMKVATPLDVDDAKTAVSTFWTTPCFWRNRLGRAPSPPRSMTSRFTLRCVF